MRYFALLFLSIAGIANALQLKSNRFVEDLNICIETATPAAISGNSTFTWDSKSFYINGKAYQIIGGQIDPQRVPRAYWAQRIQMAKAMGLNTIFSYLYWHHIEPHQGQFNFTGNNDIAVWYQEIQNAGMKAVLRPGPYICGEREWGGLSTLR